MRRLLGLFSDRATAMRGLLLALLGLLAYYFGYKAFSAVTAGHLIIRWGYYYLLLVFSMFVYFSWKLASARSEVWKGWLRRPGWAGVAILGGTLFAMWADTFKHKILFDEFVIQGTAYVMHTTKQVSTILRAYTIGGSWIPIDTYLDKRPYFFPFLVSLLHDFTGYRVANMFALNVACAAALLGLLYWFAREIAGRPQALLAVALMAMVPLFGQNTSGAGMDLHNLAMIALVACLGVLYLRVPDGDRLSLFVLAAVLLSESRYESAIFMVPTAAIVLAGWFRAGRAILPWTAIAAPLFMVPFAWHSLVRDATPQFWQLPDGMKSAFGLANVAGNFKGDMEFLFNTGQGLANSWYLSAAGVLGLGWCLYASVRWLLNTSRPDLTAPQVVGLAFGAGVAAHFGVLLFYWWSRFDDLMASRFALPLCLAFAVMVAVLAKAFSGTKAPVLRIAWAGLGVWLLVGGLPAFSLKTYTNNNLVMQELDWEKRIIGQRHGPVLFISNKSTIPFILWHIEVSLSGIAFLRGDDIRYHLSQETFKEVIVSQRIRPITEDGRMGVDPDDVMPATFHLQAFAEKRFGGSLDRLSVVTSIDTVPGAQKMPFQRTSPPSPLRSISAAQSLSEPPVASLTSSARSRYTKIE
jgi:Dolichyl-phosphate-mannose-protein mannosyltransferase